MLPCCRSSGGYKKHDDAYDPSVTPTVEFGGGLWRFLRSSLSFLAAGGELEAVLAREADKANAPIDEPQSIHEFQLRDIQSTPAFLHNPFVIRGYRCYFSPGLALRSLFRWHNETVNVWTHLLPAMYFTLRCYQCVFVELPRLESMSTSWSPMDDPSLLPAAASSGVNPAAALRPVAIETYDYLLLSFFYLSVQACFYLSALYHLMGCCSFSAHACLYRCDVSSILSLIAGSYLPALHYAFRCRTQARQGYMSIILALVCALIALFQLPSCASRKLHAMRVGALVLTIAFAVLPTAHWLLWVLPVDFPGLSAWTFLMPLIAMLGCYCAGFLLYSRHVPERWSPGTFDLLAQSHNWWHCLVVAAAVIWEHELWNMLMRKNMATCG